MNIAFIPLYIKYLGIEAYGVIGFYVMLQGWLQLLDMGMTPTLSREMARATGGSHTPDSMLDVLRSIEVLAVMIAFAMVLSVALSSGWLAHDWLRAEHLSFAELQQALVIMGIVSALRFIENLYRSSLVGLQCQVILNVIATSTATLRALGAVGMLHWISPTLNTFFIWQGIVSVVSLIWLGLVTYRALPKGTRPGRFSPAVLMEIKEFAGGMLGLTLLSLILTNVDKIVLSRLLSLGDYGYYSLAISVATSINILGSPIRQAWYPRLCELVVSNNKKILCRTFHQGSQLVAVVMGSAAAVMIAYAPILLAWWTHDAELAEKTAHLVQVLVFGNLLNGLMWMPAVLQLSFGWTRLTIYTNIVSIIIIIPAIFLITPVYGALGAAWVWVILNAGYILFGVHFMFRKILGGEKSRWYIDDVIRPLQAPAMMVVMIGLFEKYIQPDLPFQVLLIMSTGVLTIALSLQATPLIISRNQDIKLL